MITEEQKNAILNRIGALIKAKAIRYAPLDYGFLRSQIDFKIEGDSVIIFCAAPYASDLEYGTPPGTLDGSERQNLEDWAVRHGLSPKAVVKKIEREGIKVGTVENPIQVPNGTYRPFMRPAIFESLNEIKRIVNEVMNGHN